MLENPSCGWVKIHLGDFCDRASYLTDVIYDILEALIHVLNRKGSASVYFDAEGWEWYIVFTWYETFIIDYPYRTKDYDEWIHWLPEDESEERTKELNKMINKIKEMVGD